MGCGISKAETSHPLSKSELLDAESRSASDKRKGQGGEGVSRIKAEDADADAEKVLELKVGFAFFVAAIYDYFPCATYAQTHRDAIQDMHLCREYGVCVYV